MNMQISKFSLLSHGNAMESNQTVGVLCARPFDEWLWLGWGVRCGCGCGRAVGGMGVVDDCGTAGVEYNCYGA